MKFLLGVLMIFTAILGGLGRGAAQETEAAMESPPLEQESLEMLGTPAESFALEAWVITEEELRAWDRALENVLLSEEDLESMEQAWEDYLEEEKATAERINAVQMMWAVLHRDAAALRRLLADGANPDQTLPRPAPKEFLQQVQGDSLHYYLTRETNFTILMLASALGYYEGAEILLQAGADRWKKTQRHRTYALWLAAKTNEVPLIRLLMGLEPDGDWVRHEVRVDLSSQEMFLYQDGQLVFHSPISSGKKSKPTPQGEFVVTNKHRDWKSTIYRVAMPHFVRLSCSDFGFHAGRLPGYPASSGCIRLPAAKAKEFFGLVPMGTLVVIQ